MARRWTDADAERVRDRVGQIVARCPGVRIEDTHGHTGYRVRGRRFAWLLVDHHGDDRLALCVKAPPGEQDALVSADPERYFVPAYLGSRGWVGLSLAGAPEPDWDEVAELLEQAWLLCTTKSG
ncbi:MAG: MmcQ/YjbR family DNA-binding protein [Carbonactinosporaceae bacterium]